MRQLVLHLINHIKRKLWILFSIITASHKYWSSSDNKYLLDITTIFGVGNEPGHNEIDSIMAIAIPCIKGRVFIRKIINTH